MWENWLFKVLPAPLLLVELVGTKENLKAERESNSANSSGSQVNDCHKYTPAGPGDRDLLDDGTPPAASLLVKAQALATELTVGLVEAAQTQVGKIRHNDLHNCRTSYQRNAAIIHSPGPFPARASQNVDCATIPLSPVCCCQVSDGVRQIRNVYRAQEIKQKLICH